MNRKLVLLFLSIAFLSTGRAQTLTISGAVSKPLLLEASALKAMTHTDVRGKDHDGKEHRYAGIPLGDLLKRAGAPVGSELRGKNLTRYVVVKAADGYEAVFALPEIDAEFATRTIILADSVDGVALTAATGPYRIVVPDEKKQARWVRGVTVIDVRIAN